MRGPKLRASKACLEVFLLCSFCEHRPVRQLRVRSPLAVGRWFLALYLQHLATVETFLTVPQTKA